jgi:hypothetical protein
MTNSLRIADCGLRSNAEKWEYHDPKEPMIGNQDAGYQRIRTSGRVKTKESLSLIP